MENYSSKYKASSPPTSTASSQTSPVSASIHPSSYLTVPEPSYTRRARASSSAHSPLQREQLSSGLSRADTAITAGRSSEGHPSSSPFEPWRLHQPEQGSQRFLNIGQDLSEASDFSAFFGGTEENPEPFMSVYSTSSADSGFSNPPARSYSLNMQPGAKTLTQAEVHELIHALNTHRINTLIELRRVERLFATIGTAQVAVPMTNAWAYYVNSHGLLTELRALTRNYPFSSDCLDEAKRRVYADPSSNRSWNTCWLALTKLQSDQLIPYYAQWEASQPHQWGGQKPTDEQVKRLKDAFVAEWNYAVSMLLRHWEAPPCR